MTNETKEEERNFFDELDSGMDPKEAARQMLEAQAKSDKLDYLIHRVFEQNEDGKELINIWKESLIMSSTAEGGLDMLEVGIREGLKRFIRGIILTVNRVEKGEK